MFLVLMVPDEDNKLCALRMWLDLTAENAYFRLKPTNNDMAVRLGHFIYEDAGAGCLLSKYCNSGLHAPLTESASRIERDLDFPNDPFCGVFLVTWVEGTQNLETESGRLIITRKRNGDVVLQDIYTLDWQDLDNPEIHRFRGEAMLYKNMLVGAYQ
jgi:hypothetical protein